MLPAQREDDCPVRSRFRSAHVPAEWSRPSAQRRLRSRDASIPRCAPTRRKTSSSAGVRPLSRVRIATPDGPETTNDASIDRSPDSAIPGRPPTPCGHGSSPNSRHPRTAPGPPDGEGHSPGHGTKHGHTGPNHQPSQTLYPPRCSPRSLRPDRGACTVPHGTLRGDRPSHPRPLSQIHTNTIASQSKLMHTQSTIVHHPGRCPGRRGTGPVTPVAPGTARGRGFPPCGPGAGGRAVQAEAVRV